MKQWYLPHPYRSRVCVTEYTGEGYVGRRTTWSRSTPYRSSFHIHCAYASTLMSIIDITRSYCMRNIHKTSNQTWTLRTRPEMSGSHRSHLSRIWALPWHYYCLRVGNSSPDFIRNKTIQYDLGSRGFRIYLGSAGWAEPVKARSLRHPRYQEAIRSIYSHSFLAAWLYLMALIGYICRTNARQSTEFKFGTIVTSHPSI